MARWGAHSGGTMKLMDDPSSKDGRRWASRRPTSSAAKEKGGRIAAAAPPWSWLEARLELHTQGDRRGARRTDLEGRRRGVEDPRRGGVRDRIRRVVGVGRRPGDVVLVEQVLDVE